VFSGASGLRTAGDQRRIINLPGDPMRRHTKARAKRAVADTSHKRNRHAQAKRPPSSNVITAAD
jgi:hypothetical protein